jgi:NAD(P)-dependent dehydrogenase (short-subunit alcohol dehydrogenase family)
MVLTARKLVGEATGAPDILVNNGGIQVRKRTLAGRGPRALDPHPGDHPRVCCVQFVSSVEEFPPEKWDQVIAINLSSAYHATHAALPAMYQRR